MKFFIADSFTDSLQSLNNEEQKAVKTTTFDLQSNPANPGFKLHKLDRAKDQKFWSVRVNKDIRIIVHRTKASMLACYVDHHDKAYDWAEKRKLETHPKTGAAQIVKIRERVEEHIIPTYVQADKPTIGEKFSEEEILSFGIPPEWVEDVKRADEDAALELAEHLPAEAAEALLVLATGESPEPSTTIDDSTHDPFQHPDSQRRFRVFTDIDELKQALDFPWEKWTVFLHPIQRKVVETEFSGPARVSGSAGTGKTIVALHKAVQIARKKRDSRILLTTFSQTLASAMKNKLRILAGSFPKVFEQIEVRSLDAAALRLYGAVYGKPNLANHEEIQELLTKYTPDDLEVRFTPNFIWNEWKDVVDAWQLKSWDDYHGVPRLGRKTRLSQSQRLKLWTVFESVRQELTENNLVTMADIYAELTEHYLKIGKYPYDYLVIDESQDVTIPQMRFLASIGKSNDDSLFFAGDLGQRIFNQPYSWLQLGVDIRGRSKTLKINYRTSHQIRSHADKLLPRELADVDGIAENRSRTVSTFNGPDPEIRLFEDEESEMISIGKWLKDIVTSGFKRHEIGVFVRGADQLERARKAVERTGLKYVELDENIDSKAEHVAICTMHLAKGLEFKAVAVMACDDEVIPLQERVLQITDESDLDEVYSTERHLLYVACTRARDRLLVTGIEPGSEFLMDLH